MITNQMTVNYKEQYLLSQNINPADCVFFDIETTGFKAGTSHLYLIGAAVKQGGAWTIFQWMAQRPQEETLLLRSFAEFLMPYSVVIHFNGNRFDIPYLEEKCEQYQIKSPFFQMESVDLYQQFRPLKSFLKLDHMNQKSLEVFLGLNREDQFDGGRLIPVYRSFCKTCSADAQALLLLHNQEDVSGMFRLTALFGYLDFLAHCPEPSSCELITARDETSQLLLSFSLSLPVPVPVSQRSDFGYLTLQHSIGKLLINTCQDSLCYFFSDYKNYYYLPEEDQAIHKSVAAYVDRNYRQQARAENCYTRKSGLFLPQTKEQFTPAFRHSYRETQLWFSCTEEFLASKKGLQAYAQSLLSAFL